MSLIQHRDIQVRFQQQVDNSKAYVIPFIEKYMPVKANMNVMEIGCAEGGVMKPFLERGCYCVGVELISARKEFAEKTLAEYIQNDRLKLINKDIYDLDFQGTFKNSFDLIILKDVIEHIHDQNKIMGYLKSLLKHGGAIYLGFPPWYMPHGGHQQICQNKLLSWFPYVHLLPDSIYKMVLKGFKEKPETIEELMEIKDTGISIERFEKILKRNKYSIALRRFYFINPIYSYKFGWKPRVQSAVISKIPFFRNFVTTCVYYLVRPAQEK